MVTQHTSPMALNTFQKNQLL